MLTYDYSSPYSYRSSAHRLYKFISFKEGKPTGKPWAHRRVFEALNVLLETIHSTTEANKNA